MLNPVCVGHAKRNGHSIYVVLPAQLVRRTVIREGDVLAFRLAGDKIVIERLALENTAKVRTGETEVRP